MRKVMLLGALVCLCATMSLAQGTVDAAWSCAKATQSHSLEVGDQAGHAFVIDQFKCTATKGSIAGVAEKSGTGTETMEVTAGGANGHGVFVEAMANGDTMYVSYELSAAPPAGGKPGAVVDKFNVVSGTGKFKGIKSSGTCKGTPAADGSSTFACTGTWSLPKAPAPKASPPAKK